MANPYFNFKQFSVCHDRCAMKVGTDGVLLGAWTKIADARYILDIGTGSGLIALMLAQRQSNAQVDSIEIDQEASLQANENFERSPFRNIRDCENISLQNFAQNEKQKYDLIVSNPPFFERSLKSPDGQRNAARHTDSLYVEDLIALSHQLLNENGRISIIFPAASKDYLQTVAENNKLFVTRITDVLPTPLSEPKRVLLEFSKINTVQETNKLIVENERHIYSSDFTNLLKEFYLKM